MAGRRILNNIYYKYFKGNKYLVLGTTTSIKDRHNKRIKYIGYGYHTEKEKEYFVYKVYQNKYLILDTDSKPLKGPHIVYQDKKGKIYIKPYRLFISKVDHDKYPDINNDYIFEIDPKGDEEDE